MMKKRTDYINDLNSFLSSSKSCILKICEDLGWDNSYEGIIAQHLPRDEIVVCPFDTGHRMPKKSLPSHMEKCLLHKKGYSDCSLMFPPVCETGPDTVAVDEATLSKILQPSGVNSHGDKASLRKAVPLTSDRLMADFTPEERLAIYDYAVKNTTHCSEENVKEINLTSQDVQDSKPLTLEELAAAGRDAKRRRIRYKSKKVHTNRKSRTEVLEAVIQSQMDGYVEWIKQQRGESMEEESLQSSSKSKLDSNNTVQEKTSSIKEIRHGWEEWDYFGLNPHKRYINVLKEEADKKINEDNRQFHEKHRLRTKDSYRSKYDKERERNRREFSGSSYKKYKNDDSSSRYKFEKYYGNRERDEVKSKEHRSREDYRFDATRIKTEPHSSSTYDKHLTDCKTDRKESKDIKYHSSSKYYSSENYEYDPAYVHDKNETEKRIRSSSSSKNYSSYINSHSESDRESLHKSRDRLHHRHKSHKKNKTKKHSSKKKKRKRHSSTESSETESKCTDDNDS